MDSSSLHVEILDRAKRMQRNVAIAAVLAGTIAGALGLILYGWMVPMQGGVRGAKAYGGGMAASLVVPAIVVAAVVWLTGRRLVVARLREWIDDAVRTRGADPKSFAYILAMHTKPHRESDDADVLPPPRPK